MARRYRDDRDEDLYARRSRGPRDHERFYGDWNRERPSGRDRDDWRDYREERGRDDRLDPDYHGVADPRDRNRGPRFTADERGGWPYSYRLPRHSRDVPPGYRREHFEEGGYQGDRGFFERVGDEVASWFGSEEAELRRKQDARDGEAGAQHHIGIGPRNYTRSDQRILEDVSDRLTDDPHVDASDIEVSVADREVTLSGHVNRRFEKRRAEDIADSVSGVTHVQNNLRVRAAPESSGYGNVHGREIGRAEITGSSAAASGPAPRRVRRPPGE